MLETQTQARGISRTTAAIAIAVWHAVYPMHMHAQNAGGGPAVSAEVAAEFAEAQRNFKSFRAESPAEFARMKQHRDKLLNEGRRLHRFKTHDGQLIHCIEIGSQESVKRLGLAAKDIPSAPAVVPNNARQQTAAPADPSVFGMDGTLDEDGNVRRCPPGTIPVLIPSLEDLCRFKRLEDRSQKYPANGGGQLGLRGHRPPGEEGEKPPVLVGPPGADGIEPPGGHEYAHAYAWVDHQGEQADFNVWQPYVQRTDEFSLSQLWVVRGSGSDLQTVEYGWQAYYDLYGNWSPHLFIYFTTHNYNGGYPGGYNLEGNFVQTDSSIVIGGGISPASTVGGGQYHVTLLAYRDQGGSHHWWLRYGSTWIGYYPNSLFDSAGLADKGAVIDYGGEIVNQSIGGIHTATDMGSGRFPREGWAHSAFIKHIQYVDMSNYYRPADNLSRSVSGVCNYDLALDYSSDPNWENYFYFGGPGLGGGIENDTCGSALALTDNVYLAESTECAHDDAVPCLGINYKAAWFTFTPAVTGIATIDTCGSSFDTMVEAFVGPCWALSSLGCNDDACELQSKMSFPCTAGVTYSICAGGYGGASGNLQIRAHAGPANDECSRATPLTSGNPISMNTAAASNTGDPAPSCGFGVTKAVWFSFTPARSGPVGVSTCGSDFDTVLQVYTGTCGSLSAVTCNDDNGPFCSGLNASAEFTASAGTTYFVLVGGYGGESGNLQMTAYYPANDVCPGALALTAGHTYFMNTADATAMGDPNASCGWNVTKGVWFEFTPTSEGCVTINTCGSSFDTVLQVFTGTCGALVPVICNDDYGPACSSRQASVQFPGSPFTTYRIFVGGYDGTSGDLNIVANSGQMTVQRPFMNRGNFQFSVNGPPGAQCLVEASSDLIDWVPLGTYVIPVGGAVPVNDPDAVHHQARFYRMAIR